MSDQIAALPYRTMADGAFEVMLITSRDTGRWVIPKGNPMRGRAPHEAAAIEAWEEAGLRGIPCPIEIGEFVYWKRRAGGRLRRVVSVFPLAVVEQLADWPERHQRVTQWFDLTAAAAAVDEPDLKAIIAGFQVPVAPTGFVQRMLPQLRATAGKKVPMVAWFQSLLPKQGKFFDQFEAHAQTLIAGADALARLFHGQGDIAANIAEIVDQEHKADGITAAVLQDVRRVFVTPFDRSAITELIGVMDDAIDQMNGTANAVSLYGITTFEPQMRDMAGIVVEAARVTAEAIPLLRKINDNADRLNDLTARIIEIEGRADDIYNDGLKTLFHQHRENAMAFVIGREIYSSLEKIVDRFEDVANEIQGLVIDHA